MKIALIGTGVYGLAIASALTKKTKNVIMWTEDPNKYQEYKEKGTIPDLIPDFKALVLMPK